MHGTVDDRFEIERPANAGGMGVVYRARDRATGEPVALKVMQVAARDVRDRFEREAVILARLRHPAIVRYVAHGATAEGEPYLVMEWLEGEDLHQRLARQGLSLDECLRLVRHVAEALAVAHERGVVHRDLKPPNLFLPGASIDAVKVLDFGIARLSAAAGAPRTGTGLLLGTPGYMAPEQARGEREIDGRADVFALGCVLFECLTGRPAFAGDHAMAILAKILFEEAPRPSELRPGLPVALDELVGVMLAKDPSARPRDCAELLARLDVLGTLEGEVEAPVVDRPQVLGTFEQRVVTVLVAAVPRDATLALATADAPTQLDLAASTVDPVRTLTAGFGAQVERLLDGTLVATFASAGAMEQTRDAARCALALRGRLASVPIVLATGRGIFAHRVPVGDVIERAVAHVRVLAAGSAAFVGVDDTTAGLLDARFDVRAGAHGLELHGVLEQVDTARKLLGRATSFVGREREIGTLEALFDECEAEPVARVALVTGAGGIGKSRLAHELAVRLEARGATVWTGRGDGMRSDSPFALLRPALRREAGLRDGDPAEAERRKLRARVARHVRPDDVTRVTEFLGEVVGAPFPDDASVPLRAARRDAVLMGDQVRRALTDLVAAESRTAPLVLLLEDLHHADAPSIDVVDAVLRALPDAPLFVLAIARPEVRDRFPRLWADRDVQELRLAPLTKRAAERLVTEALGTRPSLGTDTLRRVVDRAAGNAYYLEELIRAVAEGRGDALPDTVLAMVQARLAALEPEARRVLRAASVYGAAAWASGIRALLGDESRTPTSTSRVDDWLEVLVERDLLVRRGERNAEVEYGFRSALVEEAAYAMLTADDRVLGHRLAGEWLERVGERDASVLAGHYERAKDPRAVGHFLRAADQSLEANDFEAAIARAEQGIAAGAEGETRGALFGVVAEARRWRGEAALAEAAADQALGLLPRGARRWFSAAGDAVIAAGKRGKHDRVAELASLLRETAPDEAALGTAMAALSRAVIHLSFGGRSDDAGVLVERMEALLDVFPEADPAIAAIVQRTHASRAAQAGDIARYLRLSEAARDAMERAGDLRGACVQSGNVGDAWAGLGRYAEAEAVLRTTAATADAMGLRSIATSARTNLARAIGHQGRHGEAEALAREAVERIRAQGNRRMEGFGLVYLAAILRAAGAFERAEAEARAAVAAFAQSPAARPLAQATLADVLLAEGRIDEALVLAREAVGTLEEVGEIEEGEGVVRLVHATAARAASDPAALDAATRAVERLRARAERIGDAALRESFLEGVPEHRATLRLAGAPALGTVEV